MNLRLGFASAILACASLMACLVALTACGDKPPAPIAALLEGQGAVERGHGEAFASAPIGQPFFVGDAARTGPGAWARLRLRDQAVVKLGADTLVRFVAGGARLETGEALAEGGAVHIETEAGPAEIEAGGVLRAIGGAGGVRFQVDIGRATIQREDGAVTLEGGAGVVVAIGGAIVERITPPGLIDAGVAAPPPDAGEIAPPAATIAVTVKGRGVTSKAGAEPWKPLPAGTAALEAGVGVKLPRGASVELARGNDRATVTGPAEITIGAIDGPIVGAKTGTTRVSARDAEVAVSVPGGVIVIRTGGDAGIEISRRDTIARVERGEVTLDGEKTDATARAGETGVIAKDGTASVRDVVPTSVDVALPTGESAIIHDPTRKVAVQIDLAGACTGGGVLELADARGSFRAPRRIGGDKAAFFAGAGVTRYRVRCDGGGAVKTGSVRVAGDTGAAAVVRTAPVNLIETDGRRYNVTYQNRLPAITVSWNEATGASKLHVISNSGPERTFDGSGAHKLASGTLTEGSHILWITTGARSSARTTVKIGFDNAAPTAQITAPPARAPWTDDVAVTGVTVEGWSVAVDGKPADRDGSGRFRAEVATAGKNAFAVRLAHPQHGVHYYLRRRK